MDRPTQPKVKLAELWERTSARGSRYFSGFMGAAQVMLFDAGEQPHPTKPDETVHVWNLVVEERDPARRPQRPPGDGVAKRSAPAGSAPADTGPDRGHGADRPASRDAGWRGPSAYKCPATPQRPAPAAADAPFFDDDISSIGR